MVQGGTPTPTDPFATRVDAVSTEFIKSAAESKPAKANPDFPHFPHASGRWAKKVRGRMNYLRSRRGPRAVTWETALELYKGVADDPHADRTPRPKSDGLTVRDLVDWFLTHRRSLWDTWEIAERSFRNYVRTCRLIVDGFGRKHPVLDLRPDGFAEVRTSPAETRKPFSLGIEIHRIRGAFKHANDAELIDRQIKLGP